MSIFNLNYFLYCYKFNKYPKRNVKIYPKKFLIILYLVSFIFLQTYALFARITCNMWRNIKFFYGKTYFYFNYFFYLVGSHIQCDMWHIEMTVLLFICKRIEFWKIINIKKNHIKSYMMRFKIVFHKYLL